MDRPPFVTRILKWVGAVLGALVVAAALVFAAAYFASQAQLNRIYHVPADSLAIPTDPSSIARGHHQARDGRLRSGGAG